MRQCGLHFRFSNYYHIAILQRESMQIDEKVKIKWNRVISNQKLISGLSGSAFKVPG